MRRKNTWSPSYEIAFIDTGYACITMYGTDTSRVVLPGSWTKTKAIQSGYVNSSGGTERTIYRGFYTCETWHSELRQILKGFRNLRLKWLDKILNTFDTIACDMTITDKRIMKRFEDHVATPIRRMGYYGSYSLPEEPDESWSLFG